MESQAAGHGGALLRARTSVLQFFGAELPPSPVVTLWGQLGSLWEAILACQRLTDGLTALVSSDFVLWHSLCSASCFKIPLCSWWLRPCPAWDAGCLTLRIGEGIFIIVGRRSIGLGARDPAASGHLLLSHATSDSRNDLFN